jgi:hypothetical protein
MRNSRLLSELNREWRYQTEAERKIGCAGPSFVTETTRVPRTAGEAGHDDSTIKEGFLGRGALGMTVWYDHLLVGTFVSMTIGSKLVRA